MITFRRDRDKAIADLEKYRIRYTDVVLVSSFGAKAEVIAERGISYYIDDQPEMLKHIPANVGVIRMVGNDRKPTTTIPLKDGYFEIQLPKALFEDNPKSIKVNWIDFYR